MSRHGVLISEHRRPPFLLPSGPDQAHSGRRAAVVLHGLGRRERQNGVRQGPVAGCANALLFGMEQAEPVARMLAMYSTSVHMGTRQAFDMREAHVNRSEA